MQYIKLLQILVFPTPPQKRTTTKERSIYIAYRFQSNYLELMIRHSIYQWVALHSHIQICVAKPLDGFIYIADRSQNNL